MQSWSTQLPKCWLLEIKSDKSRLSWSRLRFIVKIIGELKLIGHYPCPHTKRRQHGYPARSLATNHRDFPCLNKFFQPMPSLAMVPKMLVDAYQRHHWESAMASADVNGVAGNSWAMNKSASARSTAVPFYLRVPGMSFIFPQGRRRYIEFN